MTNPYFKVSERKNKTNKVKKKRKESYGENTSKRIDKAEKKRVSERIMMPWIEGSKGMQNPDTNGIAIENLGSSIGPYLKIVKFRPVWF